MNRRARERAISALQRTARRLGPTPGLRDQGALPFDGFEDQLFIGEGEAPLAKRRLRLAVLPERDRRPSKIGKPYRPMRTVGTMDEDGREIAGVVGDAQRPSEPTRPEAEHVVPIAHAEKMDAVALHPALDARQEIDQERGWIMGVAQRIRPLGDRLVPGRPRRQAYPGMPLGVVARDFQRDPALQLVERHRRAPRDHSGRAH